MYFTLLCTFMFLFEIFPFRRIDWDRVRSLSAERYRNKSCNNYFYSLLKFEILVEFMYFTLLCTFTFLFEIWKLVPFGRIDWNRVDLCLQRDIVIKVVIIISIVY